MAVCRTLICVVDGVQIAIKAHVVVRIVAAATVTRLPNLPASVEGVVSVGGRITPVFDLRSRLGMATRRPSPDDRWVVVDTGRRSAILRFDEVMDIADIDIDDLERDTGLALRDTVIEGAGSTPEGIVLLHDPDGFLSTLEEAALERAIDGFEGGAPAS